MVTVPFRIHGGPLSAPAHHQFRSERQGCSLGLAVVNRSRKRACASKQSSAASRPRLLSETSAVAAAWRSLAAILIPGSRATIAVSSRRVAPELAQGRPRADPVLDADDQFTHAKDRSGVLMRS